MRNDLAWLRSVLRHLESRDYPIDPGLFRVWPPRENRSPLPRYLSEADYGWLETNIMQATKKETYDACFDRAWFLTLAHEDETILTFAFFRATGRITYNGVD